jgi:hypothetical protein
MTVTYVAVTPVSHTMKVRFFKSVYEGTVDTIGSGQEEAPRQLPPWLAAYILSREQNNQMDDMMIWPIHVCKVISSPHWSSWWQSILAQAICQCTSKTRVSNTLMKCPRRWIRVHKSTSAAWREWRLASRRCFRVSLNLRDLSMMSELSAQGKHFSPHLQEMLYRFGPNPPHPVKSYYQATSETSGISS